MSEHKNIPIIIIHEGGTFYLPYVLSQLRISNPASPVFLIGDRSALRFVPGGVSGIDIEEYSRSADHFSTLYRDQHRNYNSFQFENKCFRRTFILADFLRRNACDCAWHIDSDNMIYTDLEKEAAAFPTHCRFASCGASPHNSFWTLECLEDYNRYTLQCITPGTEEFVHVENFWNGYKKTHTVGGVCDMTCLQLYSERHAEHFFLLQDSMHGEWNLSLHAAFPRLSRTRLFFRSPDCRKEGGLVSFYGRNMLNVHCQGFTKRFIPFFYSGADKGALFFKTLRFMPRRMAAYVYHEILKF